MRAGAAVSVDNASKPSEVPVMWINPEALAGLGLTPEEWEAGLAASIHEGRMEALPQVDALMAANWKFQVPHENASEPWQLYWRRPPRRKNSKGMFFWSTNQAFNALKREQAKKN